MKKEKKNEKEILSQELYDRLKDHLYSKRPVLGEDSPFSELLQSMVNQVLEGEMSSFMNEERASSRKNKRNGKTLKKVRTNSGDIYVETPRDRNGDFEPELIGKRERELSSGLDEQILALYAQGNSIEDVRRLLIQMYGVEISAGKISQITDKVLPEIQEWRNRELKSFYPIVYLDAIHFKVRNEGKYSSHAFYTVYSVDWQGKRDLLGLYVQGSEGASRWGIILEDLKRRGIADVLVMCTDNLTGFSEVIGEVFPKTIVQKCIVHQVRSSLKYVDSKDIKKVTMDLRKIYTAPTLEQAESALLAFEVKWSNKYQYIVDQWRGNWEELMAYMNFNSGMKKMIYTTNPVEALHRIMRKLIKSKAAWVSQTALTKQLYLSLMHNKKSWAKKANGWTEIQRSILEKYSDRISEYI
ncbi:IS256 family transposase [Pedococcus ginsenosidimutans]|uniref:Mutator family transposase n=2 Tax=Bacteria TaxID=2 RepID=A0ABP8YQW6_9MICO